MNIANIIPENEIFHLVYIMYLPLEIWSMSGNHTV